MRKPSGRKTVWVTDGNNSIVVDRAKKLQDLGFDVYFAHNVSDLTRYCEANRPSSIIVDTLSQSSETLKVIQCISTTPELSAARCLLNLTKNDPTVSSHAISAHFRDFVSWELESSEWAKQVFYAVSTARNTTAATEHTVQINQPAIVRVPARVVWMNETHVRLECRGSYRPGNSMHISGPIASAMSVPYISTIVDEIHHDKLLYRYSQALTATWSVPTSAMVRATALLRKLKTTSSGPQMRVFIGMNRVAWRKLAIANLPKSEFEVNVAMQRINLKQEFSYFTPDVIFFDDRVANNLKDSELQDMFSTIPSDSPVVVFGPDFEQEKMRTLLPGRSIYWENGVNYKSFSEIKKKYNLKTHVSEAEYAKSAVHFESENPLSKIEIELSARLRTLSSNGGSLGLPISLGEFTLARVSSPLLKKALGRDLYIKALYASDATNPLVPSQFGYTSEFKSLDITKHDEISLATHALQNIIEHYYSKYGHKMSLNLLNPFKAPEQPAAMLAPAVALPQRLDKKSHPFDIDDDDDDTIKSTVDVPVEPRVEKPLAESFEPRKFGGLRSRPQPSFDPIFIKAALLFLSAAALMGFVIYAAMHVDEDSYKDHGKEYSEFFKRMKDPDYRKQNPAPGWDKAAEYNKRVKEKRTKSDEKEPSAAEENLE
jgi:hypothetical protein